MRYCECGSEIPYRAIIDGKYRNLRNRTRCLTCLPFLTSPYSANEEERQQRALQKGREKQKRHYDKMRDQLGEGPVKIRRREFKEKLIAHFGGKCIGCGYNKCSEVLCFHHINPEEKEFSLSKREMVYSYDRLLAEANKCVLLCSNCHMELHAGEEDIKEIVEKWDCGAIG